jgi:hypothetical protein
MALRLDQIVLSGELINTKHYSTHGWLEFRGRETPVVLELTGNCGPQLAGCRIRFNARLELQEMLRGPDDASPREAAEIDWLAGQQVGPTGDMTLRQVKWFNCPAEELYHRAKLGELPPFEIKPTLYLEWYSQNGRVVLELVDPEIEVVERINLQSPAPGDHLKTDPPPTLADEAIGNTSKTFLQASPLESSESDAPPALGVTRIELGDDGNATVEDRRYGSTPNSDDEDFDDPFRDPASENLQRELDRQAQDIEWALQLNCHDDDKSEDIREMELMDALIERRTADRLTDMLDHPEQLPRPEDVGEQEAEVLLKSILGQLAMFGISIHLCPHFTVHETYRWLVDEIFPEELANRELKHTQWIQSFSTYESCPACDAEFEREWAERERNSENVSRSPEQSKLSDDDELPY